MQYNNNLGTKGNIIELMKYVNELEAKLKKLTDKPKPAPKVEEDKG